MSLSDSDAEVDVADDSSSDDSDDDWEGLNAEMKAKEAARLRASKRAEASAAATGAGAGAGAGGSGDSRADAGSEAPFSSPTNEKGHMPSQDSVVDKPSASPASGNPGVFDATEYPWLETKHLYWVRSQGSWWPAYQVPRDIGIIESIEMTPEERRLVMDPDDEEGWAALVFIGYTTSCVAPCVAAACGAGAGAGVRGN